LRRYIDWTPFFTTWELKGKYPKIFDHPQKGKVARRLFKDANRLLDRIIEDSRLTARGVYGFWGANSVRDDIDLFVDATRPRVHTVLHILRQQSKKSRGRPNRALADFVAPRKTGIQDYIGAFAVTVDESMPSLIQEFEKDHDDYHAIMVRALADRLVEALAERLHECVRTSLWGFAPREKLSNEELIAERYQSIRPAPGYPACPDHTEKRTLWKLMDVEKHAGIVLTENLAMYPAASICGLYLAHPEADYFDVGKLGKDQIQDYAARKGVAVSEMEYWLGARLNYTPGE